MRDSLSVARDADNVVSCAYMLCNVGWKLYSVSTLPENADVSKLVQSLVIIMSQGSA